MTRPKKPANIFESINCAFEGIIYAFKTQRHVRYHYLLAAVALTVSLLLRLPIEEFVIFSFAVIMLLFAEMMNTAIEETVNLVEEKHHETARNAKDVSAGAVLISSLGVIMMGYVIFMRYVNAPTEEAIRGIRDLHVHMAVVAIFAVLIAVVALKAVFGKGRPLHGGMPSGHSAVSFAMWTCITVITANAVVSVLGLIMALMVSQSRLIGGVHTKLEVFLGALLGAGLTLLIYYVFSIVLK